MKGILSFKELALKVAERRRHRHRMSILQIQETLRLLAELFVEDPYLIGQVLLTVGTRRRGKRERGTEVNRAVDVRDFEKAK